MKHNENIPDISAIDNAWLTAQLRLAGHRDTVVTNIEQEASVGTGQMAKCVRLNLTLESGDTTAPRSLIAKVPSDNEESRKTGSTLLVYRREVEFYQTFQSTLSISTPRCYFADIADDNVQFLILLEDMAPADQGNQLIGCSPEIVGTAILELVGLHAPTWKQPELLAKNGPMTHLPTSFDTARVMWDMYSDVIEGFIARYPDTFAADQIELMHMIAECETPLFSPDQELYSLIHSDYRLDNVLFSPDVDDSTFTVVDWQTFDVGNPLNDVAYFMASSLPTETRRDVEEGILKNYHRGLLDNGVENFSWDDCWQAYRVGSLHGLRITTAAMMVGRTERGDEMFKLLADRYSRHALDMQVQELFSCS